MKKPVLFFFILLAVLPAPVSWFAIEGPWLDPLVSRFLSRHFQVPIRCEKTKIVHWSKIYFDSMSVRDVVKTGRGYLYFNAPLTTIGLSGVAVASGLMPAGVLPISLLEEGLKFPLEIEEIKGVLVRKNDGRTVHVTRFMSQEALVRGGAGMRGGRIVKAHFLILVPENRLSKLPEEVTARMISRQGGWRGFRILFREGLLTVVGTHGPVLQAQWKSGG